MRNIDVIKIVSKYENYAVPYHRIYNINKCNLYAALKIAVEVQHLSYSLGNDTALKYINDNFKHFHLKDRNDVDTSTFYIFFKDMLINLEDIRGTGYGINKLQDFLTETFIALSNRLYSYYKENKNIIDYNYCHIFYPKLERSFVEAKEFNRNQHVMNFKDLTSCFLSFFASFIRSKGTDCKLKICPYSMDALSFSDYQLEYVKLTEMQTSKLINMYNIIYKKVYMDMCIRGL